VVAPAKDEVYLLADFAATARAITHGSAFIAGIDAPGSDPAEIEVLRDLGYRAVLGVGTFDRQRGYLLEIYSDGDHAELAAIAPVARVLAHYCVRAVTGRPTLEVGQSSVGAVAGGLGSEIARESRDKPSQREAAMTSLRLAQPAQPMHAVASIPKSVTGPRGRSETLG
jgi:hypothetical protein